MEDIYSDDKIREFRKNNLIEALKDFQNKKKYIMDKIKNIADNFGMDKDEIYNTIVNTTDNKLKELFIAVRLAIDPKRQNIYEKMFFDYMKENGRDIRKLPNSGSNALVLTKDKIIKGPTKVLEKTKTFDFYEKIGEQIYYYYNKYTKDQGGGQSNQSADVLNFIRIAAIYCKTNQENIKFVAVIDGEYYTDDVKNSLKALSGVYLNSRIFVLTWDTVLQTIK